MTPLIVSSEVVAVARGVPVEAGRGDRCMVSGAFQALGLVSQGLIQVCASQQISLHIHHIKKKSFLPKIKIIF